MVVPKLISALCVSSFALFFLCSAVFPQDRRLYLAFEQGRLSANIKNTPLKAVLDRINNQRRIYFDTGFMRDSPLLDNDVSVQFRNLSVQNGLERILSGINHSLILQGDSVVGVVLLGKPGKRTYTPPRRAVRRRTPRPPSRRR